MASLQGRIVEFYTGRSVAGAVVSIAGRTAITDANGFFTVSDLPLGSYALVVAHRDFRSSSTQVSLAQNMAYTLQAPIRIMSTVRAL